MATSIGVKLGIDGESEYRKQLKNIIDSTKTLDKQMGELQSSFTEETSAMEKNEAETELLRKKAEKLNEEVEMMQKAVDIAKDKFGESASETQKWQQSLASAQTELNKTNAEISSHEKAAGEMNSALGQLNATISSQQDEMEELRDAYINAVIEFGEGSEEAESLAGEIQSLSEEIASNQEKVEAATTAFDDLTNKTEGLTPALTALTDEISSQESDLDGLKSQYIDAVLQFGEASDEAQTLAGRMSDLSGELANNRQRLEDATSAASSLTGELDNTSGGMQNVGSTAESVFMNQFAPSITGMVSSIENADIVGAIGTVIELVKEIGTQAIESSSKFKEAMNEIQMATGASGADLEEMNTIAREVYYSINDTDLTMESVSSTVGTLNTRFGVTGDELSRMAYLMSAYAATVGTDGAQATNDFADILRRWDLEGENVEETIANMNYLMDQMIVAQRNGKVSTNTAIDALKNYSGTWKSLGMSTSDVLSLLGAYTNAGGEVSDITSAVDKVVTNLSGKTDDLGGTWREIITVLSESTDRFETLGAEIGDTGLTIEDVFGKKKAGAMIDVFSNSKVQADAYSDALRDASGAMVDTYYSTRTLKDDVDKLSTSNGKLLDTFIDNNFWVQLFRGEVGSLGNSYVDLKDRIGAADSAMATATSNMITNYNNLQATASKPIKFSVSAPTISYSTSGAGAGTAYFPKVHYETYAQGYDHAMILSAPTIFGAMGNRMLVGGDRPGNEVVVGEQHLLDMFGKTIRATVGAGATTINVYAAEGQSAEQVAEAVAERLQHMYDRRLEVYA